MRPSWRAVHRLVVRIVGAWLLAAGVSVSGQVQTPTAFATRVAELSEPGGYFEADNLISNETSYLQVMSALRRVPMAGGAYIGVGPDQNFSYIAQLKPSIAFIVDIRRDNMLLQLLFKALFQVSRTRVEYLSLLSGRPVPRSLDKWRDADINQLIAYVDGV